MARYKRKAAWELPKPDGTQPNKTVVHASWGEYLEACKLGAGSHETYRSSITGTKEFTGTASFEETLNLAIAGWAEGEAKAKKLTDALLDKVSSLIEVQQIRFDVEGLGFDMGLVMQGEPEAWFRTETQITEGEGTKVVKLVFNCSASCNVSPETLIAKGSVISALVQLLEMSGKRVELWAIPNCMTGVSGAYFESWVQVKAADQPLDMGRVVFATAHPSMLRRLAFAQLEGQKELMDAVGRGYGIPTDLQPDNPMRGDIYIQKSGGWEDHWENPAKAKDWLIANLRSQGVAVKEQ